MLRLYSREIIYYIISLEYIFSNFREIIISKFYNYFEKKFKFQKTNFSYSYRTITNGTIALIVIVPLRLVPELVHAFDSDTS